MRKCTHEREYVSGHCMCPDVCCMYGCYKADTKPCCAKGRTCILHLKAQTQII